jgi:4-hydroxybenzoate polyprenyltransferase
VGTGTLARVIAGPELTAWQLTQLLLGLLGGQIVVGVVNEVVDSPVDALVKPTKPIPSGLVSREGAIAFGVAGLILMLVMGAQFGWRSLLLLILGNGLGVIYSLWFKRTRFAWLPYLLAVPLLPIWVAVSFDRFDPWLLALYPVGAIAMMAVQIAQALPDVEEDRASRIDSLTTRLGERRAFSLCWALMGTTGLLVLVVTLATSTNSLLTTGGVATVVALGLVNWVVYRAHPRRGVLLTFPLVAAATGILAALLVATVV